MDKYDRKNKSDTEKTCRKEGTWGNGQPCESKAPMQ